MTVDTKHPQYEKMESEWKIVGACVIGQRAVKDLGKDVLPDPEESNAGNDGKRYRSYKQRAIYTNVTGRTVAALQGAAFREEPTIKLGSKVGYLEHDADGAGQSLVQLSKDVLQSLISTGREVLLVDMPVVEPGQTADKTTAQATIKRYGALDLINWDTESTGGKSVLTLAVLREKYNASTEEFVKQMKDQYRVLRLTEGVYTQQLYRDGLPQELLVPRGATGSSFDFIPLFIAGAQSNDAAVDEIPISDIAYVNIGHYRNSADLEENAFIQGQLTLGISSDLSAEEWTTANPNGVVVGARTGHFLGPNGNFVSIQAAPSQLCDKLQERKEAQMVALGAKLIEKRSTNDTATGSKIDAAGENSILNDLVMNVQEAIETCIFWIGLFMGESSESEFIMNRRFFPESMDPQLLMAGIQLFDRGIIDKEDLQNSSRKAGLIEADKTNEEIDGKVNDSNPINDNKPVT